MGGDDLLLVAFVIAIGPIFTNRVVNIPMVMMMMVLATEALDQYIDGLKRFEVLECKKQRACEWTDMEKKVQVRENWMPTMRPPPPKERDSPA